MTTFLLTINPTQWDVDPDELEGWIEATRSGHGVVDRWSTGSRTGGIQPGDRAFLLRQGVPDRGIYAAGVFYSEVYPGEHWDGSDRETIYADVEWDTVLAPADRLDFDELVAALPDVHWTPQTSGTRIPDAAAEALEQLWASHVRAVRATDGAAETGTGPRSLGQGRRLDAALRTEIEDLAQARLSAHYDALGWEVEDLRYGNPFDARATKGEEVLYLEAKGTTTPGERVIVTRGEVRFALEHPGHCVMGVVSGITVGADGHVEPDSGTLRILDWLPEDEDLDPLTYDFYPRY